MLFPIERAATVPKLLTLQVARGTAANLVVLMASLLSSLPPGSEPMVPDEQSVFNVEEELRGRGTISLRRCREADRQNMLGLATIGKHDGRCR